LSVRLSTIDRRLFQSKQPLDLIDHPWPIGRRGIHLREDVEALVDGFHHADAQPLGGGWKVFGVLPPHQHRARSRVDDDVEAVFGGVVDDEVEREGGSNASARALDDVHARKRETVRLQPALRLHLGRVSGALRAAREEDDFPPPISGERSELGD